MENENKWEYDYSSLYSQNNTGSTGYVNVGSSGTNAANQYNDLGGAQQAQPGAQQAQPSAQQTQPGAAAGAQQGNGSWSSGGPSYSGAAAGYNGPYYAAGGASVPPQPHYGAAQPQKPPKKHSGAAKTALTLVLAAAVGFAGGWAGAAVNNAGGSRVIVQSVQRDTSGTAGTTTSTGGSDLSLTEVSALVSPSVVVITTEEMVSSGSWFGLGQVQSGAGSGVVMSADGYILTCAHVVEGASNIIVTIDGVDYTAVLIGSDSESDIAVVKISADDLTPAVMGNSDALAVGEEVLAVGNPLGELGGTVTNGIISALNRDVVVENISMTLIQTNASVSPGNSGGGLFNMAGELIGIVNAKSADEDAEGLGFAIPVNTALSIAQQLIETGYVSGRPAMGVTVLEITDAQTAARYGVNAYGVYIADVTAGSGADKAGLKVGDRIISINGNEVSQNADLTNVISDCEVGDVVTLTIARDGQILTVDVTLGDRNAAAAQNNSAAPSEQAPSSGEARQPGGGR